MIKTIFFDFDGVLVESVDIKTNAFAELFRKEGEGIVKNVVDYHINHTGVSRYDKFRYIYKEFLKRPLLDEEFNRLCFAFANYVVDEVIKAPYVAGAKEFLERFASSRYTCYVISATPQNEIEEIVKRRNMQKFFAAVHGAPNTKADVIREYIMKEKINPANAVFIGDALSDYKAATDNSINFICRLSNNEELFRNIDCIKTRDLRCLQSILEEKFN